MDESGFMIAVCCGLIALCLAGIVAVDMKQADERGRLIAQCMADGKKEYECKAMFRPQESQVIPMPIVVPVR